MITPNGRLREQAKIVTGLAPITPSTSTPDFVSLKGYEKLAIIILADNATTVTGSAITLLQSTVVAGTDEKALEFDLMAANIDTDATDTLVETAVTSDTFTTDATNAKNLMYVIEVDPNDLDVANDFDCVRVGAGDAVASILSIAYILWPAKSKRTTPVTAITA